MTKENQLVGLETLNIRGMLANGNLAKSVSDTAIRMVHTYATYKGEWYGAVVQFIERWFPSTKLCPSRAGGQLTSIRFDDFRISYRRLGKRKIY